MMTDAKPVAASVSAQAATVPISFVHADGSRREIAAREGDSLMRAALDHDVDGIIGECGGDLSCATCHVFIDPAWVDRVPPATDGEREMLDATSEDPTEFSRLCCQIRCTRDIAGLVVTLPESQR